MVYTHSFFAMNTRFVMLIPGLSKEDGEKLAGGAEQIVENWEQCLSAFRPGAELQKINADASQQPLVLSETMGRVLSICSLYNQKTGGLFDPAVNQSKGQWQDVIHDRDQGKISFARSGLKLDMGAIGKGFALEDVVVYLKKAGVSDALISFGESSIAGMGKHPHGEGWLVGTQEGFLLRDEYLSVSGLQENKGEGKRSAAHIYHPLKQELIRATRSVMVKCSSAVEAEVLSTCAYMADDKEFEQLKKQFPAAQWQFD